ncbi:MAG: hypothetical protein JJU44_10225 [Planctomycetes bacterium]|nr:hypothetical protein [Planctomycetota bacterium]
MPREPATKEHWKVRLAQSIFIGVVVGLLSWLFQPSAGWFMPLLGFGAGLLWFLLEPLIKPRRPLRDPVREESIAATEEAIRLAEAEADRQDA